MGRRSIYGGVLPAGRNRIQFDLTIDEVRYRPTLPWTPTEANLRRARAYLDAIKAQIAANTFHFDEAFPDYCRRHLRRLPLRTRTCSHIFDAFLQHQQARVANGDLASATLTAHRQLLDTVWRPVLGPLPFVGVRYSRLIAIVNGKHWTKKTYNNTISALRRAFDFGFEDHPELHNPARSLRSARMTKKIDSASTRSVFRTRRP